MIDYVVVSGGVVCEQTSNVSVEGALAVSLVGRAVRPPLQPIPVLKLFHRVAVDVLQLPLT